MTRDGVRANELRPPPRLGEHTDEVLAELGIEPEFLWPEPGERSTWTARLSSGFGPTHRMHGARATATIGPLWSGTSADRARQRPWLAPPG